MSRRGFVAGLFMVALGVECPAQLLWNSIASPPNSSWVSAYDTWRDRFVMLGGHDTHEFDGSTWQTLLNVNTPYSSTWAAFDESAGAVLVAGGAITGPPEIWEWRGIAWQSLGPVSVTLANDGRPVFHSGLGRLLVALHTPAGLELYEWNGQSFALIPFAAMPPTVSAYGTLEYHGLAHDEAAGKLVLFGAREVAVTGITDLPVTWEWDPVSGWVNRGMSGTITGTARIWFDRHRGTIMRCDVSSVGSTFYVRTQAGTWSQMPTVIPVRWDAPCYDPGRNRLYGISGAAPWGPGYFSDVQPAGFALHAPGCATGTVPTLGLSQPWSRAWPGLTFSVDIGNLTAPFAILAMGFHDQTYNLNPLPLALAGSGMPGCSLNIDAVAAIVLPVANWTATATIPIPNAPGLVGQPFFQQAFAAVPGANPLGVLVSDSMRGTVGRFQ